MAPLRKKDKIISLYTFLSVLQSLNSMEEILQSLKYILFFVSGKCLSHKELRYVACCNQGNKNFIVIK